MRDIYIDRERERDREIQADKQNIWREDSVILQIQRRKCLGKGCLCVRGGGGGGGCRQIYNMDMQETFL